MESSSKKFFEKHILFEISNKIYSFRLVQHHLYILPLFGLSKPIIISINVLFPDPVVPSMPIFSPLFIVRFKSFNTKLNFYCMKSLFHLALSYLLNSMCFLLFFLFLSVHYCLCDHTQYLVRVFQI